MPEEVTPAPSWVSDLLVKIEYGPRDACWRWLGHHDVNGRPQHGTSRSGISTMASHRVQER